MAARPKQPDFFQQPEKELIDNITEQLRFVDRKVAELSILFREIIAIFETTRSKIIQVTGEKTLSTVTLEIDLSLEVPELRISIKPEPKSKIERFMSNLRGKKVKTEILLLTATGYNLPTPESLERHHAEHKGRHHEAKYSVSSYSNLKTFLNRIQNPE